MNKGINTYNNYFKMMLIKYIHFQSVVECSDDFTLLSNHDVDLII